MDYSLSTLPHQEPDYSQETPQHQAQQNRIQSHPPQQSHPPSLQARDPPLPYPSVPSLEDLSISEALPVVVPCPGLPLTLPLSPIPAEPLPPRLPHLNPPGDPILWQTNPSSSQPFNLDTSSVMDSAAWPGSNASAQHNVGPISMGFEWSREQNLSPSDSSARSMGLQNTFHAQGANQNSANNSGNGNGNAGTPGNLVEESGLGHNGVPGGVGSASAHHNGDPLASTLGANTLPQSGDLQLRTSPPSPPRDDSHHHPHSHHAQQAQLHVHHTHPPYHHSQISGHELSQHEQQQQQSFQSQHSAYASAHYYAEADQHDPYEHGRMHSGGLVGHSYGHSHDNLAALTPPPPAPVPSHDLPPLRTRLTNTIWEDEHTFCYQVDVKGVCVARRAGKLHLNSQCAGRPCR